MEADRGSRPPQQPVVAFALALAIGAATTSRPRVILLSPTDPADDIRLVPQLDLATLMPARLHRWDEIALVKVTEMVSQKIVSGDREMLAQTYLKRGALVPLHTHESEQMTYVLQGSLKVLVNGEEIVVSEGEVLHIPAWAPHQAEALEDTFELDVFSPIRKEWLPEDG